jgi:hypothetical protein
MCAVYEKGTSMKKKTVQATVAEFYHGNDDKPDLIPKIKTFLNGEQRFSDMWNSPGTPDATLSHAFRDCLGGLPRDSMGLTGDILKYTSLQRQRLIDGTLLTKDRVETNIKEAKKMVAYCKEFLGPDGEPPSGLNMDDIVDLVCKKMWNERNVELVDVDEEEKEEGEEADATGKAGAAVGVEETNERDGSRDRDDKAVGHAADASDMPKGWAPKGVEVFVGYGQYAEKVWGQPPCIMLAYDGASADELVSGRAAARVKDAEEADSERSAKDGRGMSSLAAQQLEVQRQQNDIVQRSTENKEASDLVAAYSSILGHLPQGDSRAHALIDNMIEVADAQKKKILKRV